jgi:hypothetical protein
MASMMTVRVLVAVLPQMSMAIDRGRAPRSVRQKSSIGCAFFWNEQSFPSLSSVPQLERKHDAQR